jgi:glycosyltransferase involved in cell wall biosynthesis
MTYAVNKRLPYLSIIVPVHNEQTRIRQAVFKIIRWAEQFIGEYEIILVENGSADETFAIARELSHIYRPVQALQVDGRSKAAAVRFGMLMARGEYRYMCDVDLSTPIDELSRFLKVLRGRDGWDIVVGSREHPASQVKTSLKRWAIGRTFNMLVSLYTGLDYHDTQCGFKLFNRRSAEDIFNQVACISMAFDVEVLYIASQRGYSVMELPVIWYNDTDSRVRLVRDSWSMFRDLQRIRKMHATQPEMALRSNT